MFSLDASPLEMLDTEKKILILRVRGLQGAVNTMLHILSKHLLKSQCPMLGSNSGLETKLFQKQIWSKLTCETPVSSFWECWLFLLFTVCSCTNFSYLYMHKHEFIQPLQNNVHPPDTRIYNWSTLPSALVAAFRDIMARLFFQYLYIVWFFLLVLVQE